MIINTDNLTKTLLDTLSNTLIQCETNYTSWCNWDDPLAKGNAEYNFNLSYDTLCSLLNVIVGSKLPDNIKLRIQKIDVYYSHINK